MSRLFIVCKNMFQNIFYLPGNRILIMHLLRRTLHLKVILLSNNSHEDTKYETPDSKEHETFLNLSVFVAL